MSIGCTIVMSWTLKNLIDRGLEKCYGPRHTRRHGALEAQELRKGLRSSTKAISYHREKIGCNAPGLLQ